MDKQLNQCDASELLRTEAILVLQLIMRARGDCVSRSFPRDQETTSSGDEIREIKIHVYGIRQTANGKRQLRISHNRK